MSTPVLDAGALVARFAPGPVALYATLTRLGIERAAHLDPDTVEARVDGAHAERLLASDRGWAPVVATLCEDPDTLAGLCADVLADRTHVGWVKDEVLAARLVANPAVSDEDAQALITFTNPYSYPDESWTSRLENPSGTRAVAETLVRYSRDRGRVSSAVRPLLAAPDLPGPVAVWLLEQVIDDGCDDAGAEVFVQQLRDHHDLTGLLSRPDPDADPDSSHTADDVTLRETVGRLQALAAAHTTHWCAARTVSAVLYQVAKKVPPTHLDPAGPATAFLDHVAGLSALVKRADLPGACYPTLVTAAAAQAAPDTRAALYDTLARNTGCPDELLLGAPAATADYHLLLRVCGTHVGDDAGSWVLLERLLSEDALAARTVQDVLEVLAGILADTHT